MDEGKLKLNEKSVVFWDEAAMADTQSYFKIVQKVNEANAKLILVGEAEQIQSVAAGSSFRFLTEQFETNTARIHEINRQNRHWNREMVEDFARGESRKGVKTLHEKGKVDVSGSDNERIERIVDDYLNTQKVSYDGSINVKYVTKTGVEKSLDVSELRVKALQKADVDLRTDRVAVDKVLKHDELLEALTSKDKHDIEFVKKAIYEQTGDQLLRVTNIKDNLTREVRDLSFEEKLVVCPVNDKRNEINLAIREKLKEVPEDKPADPKYAHVAGMLKGEDVVVQVKTKNGIEEKPMAVGEKIMITANIWSNDQDKIQLNNNQKGEIVEFIKNTQGEDCAMRLKMEEGEIATLSLNGKLDIDYSYATTTHKSQGQTKEHVFYYVDDSMVNLHQAYVACSRNRDEFKMYLSEEMVSKAEAQMDGKVPTAGMIQCANEIAEKKTIELEDGTLDSFLKTRAWLNENYKAIDGVSQADFLLDRFIDVVDAMGQTEFKKTSFDFEVIDGKHQATYLSTALDEEARRIDWVESGKNRQVVEPPPEAIIAKVVQENQEKAEVIVKAEKAIKTSVDAIEKEVDTKLAKEAEAVAKTTEVKVDTAKQDTKQPEVKAVVVDTVKEEKKQTPEAVEKVEVDAKAKKVAKPEPTTEVSNKEDKKVEKVKETKKPTQSNDRTKEIEAEKERLKVVEEAIRKIEEENRRKTAEQERVKKVAESQLTLRRKK